MFTCNNFKNWIKFNTVIISNEFLIGNIYIYCFQKFKYFDDSLNVIFLDVPELQKFFFQEDIVVGQRVSITCSVKQYMNNVSFRWLKNGKNIDTSDHVRIKDDQEFSVLIIDSSNLDDEGNYTCLASNSYGTGKHTAYLSVKGKNFVLPSD